MHPSAPVWGDAPTSTLHVTEHDKTHEMAVASGAVWYFTGEAPNKFVKDRVVQMLVANPWLISTFTKHGKQTCWVYPSKIDSKDLQADDGAMLGRHFVVGETDLHSQEKNYMKLQKAFKPYLCLQATELLKKENKNATCFQVSLVRDTSGDTSGGSGDIPNNQFALILSVNHVLADGETMYALSDMLSESGKVRSIQCERLKDFEIAQTIAVGKEKIMFSFGNYGFLCGLIGAILGDLRRGKPRDVLLCEVDGKYLERRKQESKKDNSVPFVSTNDILTSLLFTKLIPARVGLMEGSLRDKGGFPASKQHAGNYTVMMPYFFGDSKTPCDVRQSMKPPGKEPKTDSDSGYFQIRCASGSMVPGCLRMLAGKGRYVAITNWARIDKFGEMKLPSSVFTVHLPMMDMDVPSPFDGCIVWRPSVRKTAVLCFSRKRNLLPQKHEAYGERIMNFSTVQRAAHKNLKYFFHIFLLFFLHISTEISPSTLRSVLRLPGCQCVSPLARAPECHFQPRNVDYCPCHRRAHLRFPKNWEKHSWTFYFPFQSMQRIRIPEPRTRLPFLYDL